MVALRAPATWAARVAELDGSRREAARREWAAHLREEPSAIHTLVRRLDDLGFDGQLAVCEFAARSPLAFDTVPFTARLRSAHATLRAAAATVLARPAFATPATLLALIAACMDHDPIVQSASLAALAVVAPSEAVIEPLANLLATDRHSVASYARRTLQSAPEATLAIAVRALDRREPLVQRGAIEVLRATGQDLSPHAPPLARLAARGHDVFLRRTATRALGRCSRSDAASKALQSLRGDWDTAVGLAAAVALGQLSLAREPLFASYAGAIRRVTDDDVGELATALRSAGLPQPPAWPVVERMSRANGYARLDLADALWALATEAGHPTVSGWKANGRFDEIHDDLTERTRVQLAANLLRDAREGSLPVRAAAMVFATHLERSLGHAMVLQHIADDDPDAALRQLAKALLDPG